MENTYRNRMVTVNANRNSWKIALFTILGLGIFAVAYWMIASRTEKDFNSPQTDVNVERPFNSSVLPRSESTPVGQ